MDIRIRHENIYRFIMLLKELFDGNNKLFFLFFSDFRKCASRLDRNIATSASFFSTLHIHKRNQYEDQLFYFCHNCFLYLRLHRSRSGQVMFHSCILLDWIDHKRHSTVTRSYYCIQKSKMQRKIILRFLHVLSVYIISFNQVLLQEQKLGQ